MRYKSYNSRENYWCV